MSSTTQTPTTAEAATSDVADADASSRDFPGRVRGQRLEITSADLKMYSAITGRKPSEKERDRALTWSESDPLKDQIADAVGMPNSDSSTALAPMGLVRSLSPSALSTRIRDMWFNGVTIRVQRPHFSEWFKRLSAALHQGRQRVKKAG